MSVVRNAVRRGFYLDSVALMRIGAALEERPGVARAALMIGTPSNLALLQEAGLLADAEAGPNDLVIAVAATVPDAADAALVAAAELLDRRRSDAKDSGGTKPRSLAGAIDTLAGANLALISVPGVFAAGEARAALRRGLNVMIFSDNVPIADEVALKREARERGLLVMGPDCGTAMIAGAPLGFCNVVPSGGIGIVGASGTGTQEVMCLVARLGEGVSHAIGTGGRDLKEEVGGATMLAAIDALDRDTATGRIVLVSKPPAEGVARRLLDRVAASRKEFTICFLGAAKLDLPRNACFAPTLRDAAELAAGHKLGPTPPAPRASARRRRGLFAGGTLCAEAQLVLRRAGMAVASNAPVPGVPISGDNLLLDLGADEYTLGRPHPMIEPAVRTPLLVEALNDPEVGLVLLDVVLGWGGHADPAGAVAEAIVGAGRRKLVIASVCGTDADPQNRAAQVAALQGAGVIVAPSNAQAAELAAASLSAA